MIQIIYKTSDGREFLTLSEARYHECISIVNEKKKQLRDLIDLEMYQNDDQYTSFELMFFILVFYDQIKEIMEN